MEHVTIQPPVETTETPKATQVTAELLAAEAEAIEHQLQLLKELAATTVGRDALRLAGVPDTLIDNPEASKPDALGSVELQMGRIALGGL